MPVEAGKDIERNHTQLTTETIRISSLRTDELKVINGSHFKSPLDCYNIIDKEMADQHDAYLVGCETV